MDKYQIQKAEVRFVEVSSNNSNYLQIWPKNLVTIRLHCETSNILYILMKPEIHTYHCSCNITHAFRPLVHKKEYILILSHLGQCITHILQQEQDTMKAKIIICLRCLSPYLNKWPDLQKS